jgi:hypothetical protein
MRSCSVGGIFNAGTDGKKQDTTKNGGRMPKLSIPLTIPEVENAIPKEKEYKIPDGGGLYLLVKPSGGKFWRLAYRFDGKQKTLSLKNYPDRSLEDARNDRKEARQLLAKGVDPSELRKQLSAIDKAERIASQVALHKQVSVRVEMEGVVEICKGRISVSLSNDEALFVMNQLCKLLA